MTATTEAGGPPGSVSPPGGGNLFWRPPTFVFHGVLVATGFGVLWAFSFPGAHIWALLPCLCIVGLAALSWLVRAATYLRARRRAVHSGTALWFAVAPAGALVLALLLSAEVPLRVRWQMSKSDFRDAVATLRAEPADSSRWSPRRVGSYRVTAVDIVDQGIVFHEEVGFLLADAGFAYLPDGPSPAMASGAFEDPQWFALDDDWYAWTASW